MESFTVKIKTKKALRLWRKIKKEAIPALRIIREDNYFILVIPTKNKLLVDTPAAVNALHLYMRITNIVQFDINRIIKNIMLKHFIWTSILKKQ